MTISEPANVLIVSCEDGADDTIVPRLMAAEANLERIRIVSVVLDAKGEERLPSIPADLTLLEKAIDEHDARLVIIDPLVAYLPDNVNTHKDQSVRRALAPLARLAERSPWPDSPLIRCLTEF